MGGGGGGGFESLTRVDSHNSLASNMSEAHGDFFRTASRSGLHTPKTPKKGSGEPRRLNCAARRTASTLAKQPIREPAS